MSDIEKTKENNELIKDTSQIDVEVMCGDFDELLCIFIKFRIHNIRCDVLKRGVGNYDTPLFRLTMSQEVIDKYLEGKLNKENVKNLIESWYPII